MDKQVYLNPKQLAFLQAPQKTRVLVAGRGFGKSRDLSYEQAAKATALPRGKNFLASTTYGQLLTKTWPAIAEGWESLGYVEDIHYVMGRQPPKHFKKAISPPKRFGNVVTFMNGYTIDMVSMDRPELARGGSYDGGSIDEAALVKQEEWAVILLPSIRGNKYRFGHSQWWQMVGFYTSLPWKASGYWILDYEQKAQDQPDKYFYMEASAMDNIAVLGEEGIQRMREEMSWLQFQTEVMNVRILQVEDAFYHKYDRERHTYIPGYLYGANDQGRDVITASKDVDPKRFLELSFDFSGWFNGVLVFQENANREERMVDSFFVKGDEKLAALVKNFCTKYRHHKHKFVRLWGEPRGHDRNATAGTIYQQLVQLLALHGWRAEVHAPAGQSKHHIERNHYMAAIMAEETRGYPHLRMNEETCKDVRIAIQSVQTLANGSKDKSKEKERNFPQEHAPHFTDMLDYYFEQKWARRVGSAGSGRASQASFG